VLSCVVGVLPAALMALACAAALAIVTGEGDVAVLMNSIGLPAVGLLALVLSAWTVNASNVYSAGLGFAVMLGRDESGSKVTTLVAGIAGIALALGGILGQFEMFLSFLSATAPALAGAVVADYWIVRRARPENVELVEGFSVPGAAALGAGVIVGLVTGGAFVEVPGLAFLSLPFFLGPVNALAASILSYTLVYYATGRRRFTGPVRWRTPDTSTAHGAERAAACDTVADFEPEREAL